MISGVMRLADRQVAVLMTVRADVDWINLDADEAAIRERLATTEHSRHIRLAPAVPENVDALDVVEVLRAADIPMRLPMTSTAISRGW
jgi:putative hemolysin